MFHTIGQRQGLGIGGIRDSNGEPWYVVGKDTEKNRLIVAQGKNHPALFKRSLQARDLHWISATSPPVASCRQARIRYRQPDQACKIMSLNGDSLTVSFTTAQRAITPGQAIVFYDGDQCLGGGTICA